MPTLVEQLQIEAVDPKVSTPNLLRKVKLIAAKLNLSNTIEWVDHELNGYTGATAPEYRKVSGQPRAFNPFNGWIPITGRAEMMEILSQRVVGQSVAGLEALLTGGDDGLYMPYSPRQIELLSGGGEPEFPQMGLHISRSAIVAILDAVRSKVLDWAIGLEREGILGTEVGFTPDEARRAQRVTIQIGEFKGNLSTGDAVGTQSRINLGSTDSSMNLSGGIFGQLHERASAIADSDAREAVTAAITAMEKEQGGNGFTRAYTRFMEVAADHMSVFVPLLPALAQLLG